MAESGRRLIGERLDRIRAEPRELRALNIDVALLAERTGRLEKRGKSYCEPIKRVKQSGADNGLAGHGLLRFARNDWLFEVASAETRLDHVASKVAALDSRFDAVQRSLGARPDRAAAQAVTNLQITLAALQDKPVQQRLCPC